MVIDDMSLRMDEDELEAKEVMELPIEDFREKYGQYGRREKNKALPFRALMQCGNTSIIECWDCEGTQKKFRKLEDCVVRYIPYDDKTVHAAVILDKSGKIRMRFQRRAVYEFGVFYDSQIPKAEVLNRIYEDLKENPVTI